MLYSSWQLTLRLCIFQKNIAAEQEKQRKLEEKRRKEEEEKKKLEEEKRRSLSEQKWLEEEERLRLEQEEEYRRLQEEEIRKRQEQERAAAQVRWQLHTSHIMVKQVMGFLCLSYQKSWCRASPLWCDNDESFSMMWLICIRRFQ